MKSLLFATLFLPALAQQSPTSAFDVVHRIVGSGDNSVLAAALGPDGSIYIAGVTSSPEFETTPNAARTLPFSSVSALFLRRLSPDGSRILYSTFVSPASGIAGSLALSVDPLGNAYVASNSRPDSSQPITALEPTGAVYLTKISPDGARFLYRVAILPEGSGSVDVGLAADATGAAYLATGDGAVAVRKIDPAGARIEAQTRFICPNGNLRVKALALGPGNSVYIAGRSTCPNFPASPNAYLATSPNSQNTDAFLLRLSAALDSTIFATLFGSRDAEEATAVTVAPDGSATIAGETSYTDTQRSFSAPLLGMAEPARFETYAFLATISPDGTTLKGAALLPAPTVTAVAIADDGSILLGATSTRAALFAKLSPDLQTLLASVNAPAPAPRIPAVFASGNRLLFAASANALTFPDNTPSVPRPQVNGFAGFLAFPDEKADLQLQVQATLASPDIYNSSSSCLYTISNRGPVPATGLLLAASPSETIERSSGSFKLWQSSQANVNVPSIYPTTTALAAVPRLAPGESVSINFIYTSGVSGDFFCSGRAYSTTADANLIDNQASASSSPNSINVSVLAPRGVRFLRDDWPVFSTSNGIPLRASKNGQIRIFFPTPQLPPSFFPMRFTGWSDGNTDNPRTFSLGETDITLTPRFTVDLNITTPGSDTPDSAFILSVQPPDTPIHMEPAELPTAAPSTEIVVNGAGFLHSWEILWNGLPRPAKFLNSYQFRVTLEPADLDRPGLNWIALRDPESNRIVRTPQPFWVHLQILNSDAVYDPLRSRLWVASPAANNRVLLLNPESGSIEQTIPLPAEPQKLALTSDSRFLYIGTTGRIYRLDTELGSIDQDFPIPAIPGISQPIQASSIFTVPDRPAQLLVSLSVPFAGISLQRALFFDNGVPAGPPLSSAYGPTALYGWVAERIAIGGDGASFYTINLANGGSITRTTTGLVNNPGCVFESSRLYCGTGDVFDATSLKPVLRYPARGALGLATPSDRVLFIGTGGQLFGSGAVFAPIVTLRQSTGEILSSFPAPILSDLGTLISAGNDTLLYRFYARLGTDDRLYLFQSAQTLPPN